MYGWAGALLWVDLTKRTIEKKPLDLNFAKDFLGGRGFNSKLLYDLYDSEEKDPFSPENIICISTGVLAGTLVPSSGRVTISFARSPITGVFGDANSGGHFGPEIKYAGYDAIVIRGASSKPVYLSIQDDEVELRSAEHLWGKDIWETNEILKKEVGGPKTQVYAIGPAGENKVAGACALCNLSRASGAGGNGALLGSKMLKGVAVRGTRGFQVADPDAFLRACDEAYAHIKAHPLYKDWQIYGTTCLLDRSYVGGAAPIRNWQANELAGWEGLSANAFESSYSQKSRACFSCPLHCSHYYRVEEGSYAGTHGEGPEYEAVGGLGLKLGITDYAFVLYLNTLHNRWGLDVIQNSSVCSTAMHLWQDNILDPKDTEGLILDWGNKEAVVELTKQVVFRTGFGKIFSDGILQGVHQIAARKGIAPGKLERYVIHTKGMAYAGVDLRKSPGAALGFATATRGGDHLRGRPKIPPSMSDDAEKISQVMDIPMELAQKWVKLGIAKDDKYQDIAHVLKFFQDQCAAADAVEICKFASAWRFGIGPARMANLITAATGIKYNWKDILQVGERIYTVEYAMQRRFGLGRESDQPPMRFFKEKSQQGQILDKKKYEAALSQYYQIRGYDQNGVPTEKKLKALGLDDVAIDMKQRKVAESLEVR